MAERTERFHVDIDATPADVWRMLTTGEGLASWFGTRARIDLRVGGDVEVGWGPDEGPGDSIASRITALDPQRRLRLAYLADGREVGAEEWLVSSHGTTTRLTLVHSMPDDGIDDWDGFYGDMRRGWRLFLASLRHALESAATPLRTAECRSLPMPGDRGPTWADLTAAVALDHDHATAPLVADMEAVVADPPHSLLLASPTRTLLCDVEGSGDQQVLYLQAAVHGGSPAWATAVLDDLATILTGTT